MAVATDTAETDDVTGADVRSNGPRGTDGGGVIRLVLPTEDGFYATDIDDYRHRVELFEA